MTDDELTSVPEGDFEPLHAPDDFEPAEAPAAPYEPRSRSGRRHSSAHAARSARPDRSRRSSAAPRAQRPGARGASAAGLPTSATARTRRLVVALSALAIIVGVLGYVVWSTLYRAEAAVPAGRSVTIVVAQGTSGEALAAQLAKAGIVPNATMFRVQAQLMNATADMKAGTYTLVTGSSYEAVIRRLQAGPPAPVMVTLTVPEGWGIERTAARVESLLHIPAADFIELATTGAKQFNYPFLDDNPTDSLEGYLFPKTYQFKPGVKAAEVINTMLAQFAKETAGLDYSYARKKGISPHGALTIASIIEREASVPSDRPNVASVIYNRLAINMRLQLDSTVQYALHGKAKLSLADLQNQSPYNTYQHNGLPPGPICSPGIVAIKAALAPAKTKYLYYILTYKDGRQSFATNYADFLRLKAQFKKGLK